MAHSDSGRVLNTGGVLHHSDQTRSTPQFHVGCSVASTGKGTQLWPNTRKEPNVTDSPHSVTVTGGLPRFTRCHTETSTVAPCTNIKSNTNHGRAGNAQAWASKGRFPGTPGVPIFCTIMNPKVHLQPDSVRLCHNSSKDTKINSRQTVSGQTLSDTDTDLSDSRSDGTAEAQLTHTDALGRAAMVDVGGKAPSRRTATAHATVVLGPAAFRLLRDNQLAKGDALAVAQLAGIMASKQTSALIPLCHPLPLDHISVAFHLEEQRNAALVVATCSTAGRTGVEMEALTAASVAALTVYDMCKAVSHDIVITDIKLVSKTGGKKDFHRQQGDPTQEN